MIPDPKPAASGLSGAMGEGPPVNPFEFRTLGPSRRSAPRRRRLRRLGEPAGLLSVLEVGPIGRIGGFFKGVDEKAISTAAGLVEVIHRPGGGSQRTGTCRRDNR